MTGHEKMLKATTLGSMLTI